MRQPEVRNQAVSPDAGDGLLQPYLVVRGPGGENFSVAVPEGTTRTIGRGPENDVVLRDDPLVSRVHCSVRVRDDALEVTDHGSLNGTLIYQLGEWRWLRNDSALLGPGDIIRITGRSRPETGGETAPGFWDLTFQDPLATQPVESLSWAPRLEFAWKRAKIFRIDGARRQEVALHAGSQEFRLLRYMDDRNQHNHNIPIDCTHDELIGAVWEGDQAQGHTPNDIAHLIRDLRTRLEPRPEAPRFLVTVRGGYRLVSQPLPELTDPTP